VEETKDEVEMVAGRKAIRGGASTARPEESGSRGPAAPRRVSPLRASFLLLLLPPLQSLLYCSDAGSAGGVPRESPPSADAGRMIEEETAETGRVIDSHSQPSVRRTSRFYRQLHFKVYETFFSIIITFKKWIPDATQTPILGRENCTIWIQVKWGVYFYFLKCMGLSLSLVMVLMYGMSEGFLMSSNLALSKWASEGPRNRTVDVPRNRTVDAPRNWTVDASRNWTVDGPRNRTVDAPRDGSVDASRDGSVDGGQGGAYLPVYVGLGFSHGQSPAPDGRFSSC